MGGTAASRSLLALDENLRRILRVSKDELRHQESLERESGTKVPGNEQREPLDHSLASVESWAVSIADVLGTPDLRLDASHFDPQANAVTRRLEESGFPLRRLSELASVELRGQFARIWAQDERYGARYLNATDMLSLLALGVPAGGIRFLSYATETDVNRLLIREGWLLMTCSGTIGRVFYVPKRLDGWAATHDLIRIVPNDPGMVGYLHAWLETPLAQIQIMTHTHGGQIDHVTDKQVAETLVPLLPEDQQKRINRDVMHALHAREEAIETLTKAWDGHDG